MRGKPFEPGNKFGRGRPRGSGYVELCQAWAEQDGWQQLIDIANGKPQFLKGNRAKVQTDHKLRLEAIKILLGYGYGRPREAVEVSGSGPQTIADLLGAALRARTDRVSAGDLRKPGVVLDADTDGESTRRADREGHSNGRD